MLSNFFDNPVFFRTALEELPIGIYAVDREQRIRFWNRGAEHIIGHLAHEVVGRIYSEHAACDQHGRILCSRDCPVGTTLRDGKPRGLSAFYLHKLGHRVSVKIRSHPLIANGDTVEGAIVLFEEALEPQTESAPEAGTPSPYGCLDAVTDVPSHRLTRAVLAEWIAGMEECRHGFGILRVRVLGLDEFRSKHGPLSAIPFMQTAARTLRHSLHQENFLGRWGEDEFIAVLPSANPVATAAAAETIWNLVTNSEVRWWGDIFPVLAVVTHAVAQPGDKLEKLLNGLEPTHAAAAGRAVDAAHTHAQQAPARG
jgi:PAS domain S-box-containing protein